MKGYNHVTIVGNVIKDSEIKEVGDHKKANFVLAVNRNYKNANGQNETDFIPVVSWGKLAEICGEHLNKGKRVLVDGRIQVRNYEKDEEKKWVTEIIADEVTMLSAPPKTTKKK